MPKKLENPNDIIDRLFGKLIVKEYLGCEPDGRNKKHLYRCDCSCGTKNVITTRQLLLKGDKSSCGCAHKDAGNRMKEDLTDKVFERWRVLGPAPTRYSKSGKTRSTMWECQCKCGTIKTVSARALKTGMSTSCGCLQKEHVSNALVKDLSNQVFGYLKVIERAGSQRPKNGEKHNVRAMWLCECECKRQVVVTGESLRNGDITSCGCKKISKYELYTMQYLDSIGYVRDIDYIKEKTFDGLKGLGGQNLRFDFYLVLKTGETVLIECQGEQHIRPAKWFGGEKYFKKLQVHDDIKRKFAADNGYRLIEVPYTKVLYSDIEEFLKFNNIC